VFGCAVGMGCLPYLLKNGKQQVEAMNSPMVPTPDRLLVTAGMHRLEIYRSERNTALKLCRILFRRKFTAINQAPWRELSLTAASRINRRGRLGQFYA